MSRGFKEVLGRSADEDPILSCRMGGSKNTLERIFGTTHYLLG